MSQQRVFRRGNKVITEVRYRLGSRVYVIRMEEPRPLPKYDWHIRK